MLEHFHWKLLKTLKNKTELDLNSWKLDNKDNYQ